MNKPSGKLAFAYATIANLEDKIARLEAEQPAPVAVVLPERKQAFDDYSFQGCRDAGWNECLDEVIRINK